MAFPDHHETNKAHAFGPKVGDYWNEMYVPICVVVDVNDFCVITCESIKSTSEQTWTWDLAELKTYTRKEFAYRWTYGRIGNENYAGDSDKEIDNKYWCRVFPEAHTWVRDAARQIHAVSQE